MMADEIVYKNEAAAGYDRAVARVSKAFVSPLLRAAELAPGDRVLDIATGTGLVAEAVLAEVGRTGHVTAAPRAGTHRSIAGKDDGVGRCRCRQQRKISLQDLYPQSPRAGRGNGTPIKDDGVSS
jgi:hypothetical protein